MSLESAQKPARKSAKAAPKCTHPSIPLPFRPGGAFFPSFSFFCEVSEPANCRASGREDGRNRLSARAKPDRAGVRLRITRVSHRWAGIEGRYLAADAAIEGGR